MPIKLFATLLSVTLAFPAQFNAAEQARLSRLSDSYLIENIERSGDWATKISASMIEYTCLTCDGAVKATIEVLAPYTTGNYPTLEQRFLSERQILCARIAALNAGRCVRTNPTGMRGDALSGFQSELELAGTTEIEIVFFYHEEQFGPELIKATVSIEDGATLPPGSIEMFRWHMAKLTLFW